MGCNFSQPSRLTSLSQKQKYHIRNVWSKIKEDNMKQEFGNNIYKTLLLSEKQIRYLFPKIVLEDGGEKFTIDEKSLQRHAALVMDGIGFAVECIDNLPKLNKFLFILGSKHHGNAVPFQVLEKLWSAFDYSFQKLLPDVYDREARKAWSVFFYHMITVMKSGMGPSET